MRNAALAIALAISLASKAYAQSSAASAIPKEASFEVAAIKPGIPGENHGIRFLTSFTRVETANTSVTDLLKYAYGLHGDQIVGGDDKLMHEGYAINAVISADTPTRPSAELLKQMLRNLLADRFGLAFHTESRELPVYLLTDAGAHLTPTKQEVPMATGGYGNGTLIVHHGSPRDLAAYLQRFVTDRPVTDHTGIQGSFDMELHFTPEDTPAKPDNTGPEYPGLFTAIHEQLGLKLAAGKSAVDVMVIDHVTEPTAN